MNTLSGVTRTNIMNSGNSHSLLTKRMLTLMKPTRSLLQQQQQMRSITTVSRLGKRKTCKAVLKRFRRVRGGYLKRWRSGMVKKQRKKSSWRKFRLRGSILVKRPSHLRTLNKMMYKYWLIDWIYRKYVNKQFYNAMNTYAILNSLCTYPLCCQTCQYLRSDWFIGFVVEIIIVHSYYLQP